MNLWDTLYAGGDQVDADEDGTKADRGGSGKRRATTQGPQAGVDYPDAEGWSYDPDTEFVRDPNNSFWFLDESDTMFAMADRLAAEQADTTSNTFDMLNTVYGAKDGKDDQTDQEQVDQGQAQVEREPQDTFQNTFSTWNTTFDSGAADDTLQGLTQLQTQTDNQQTLQSGQNAVNEASFFGSSSM